MKWHEFATVFPMLGDDDLQQLADDIERNGQRFPVIVDEDGLVLDGRNRATACRMLGIEPRVEVFSGSDAEKLEYVVSLISQGGTWTPASGQWRRISWPRCGMA